MALEPRRSHIVRVYGRDETADGGPDNSDAWVDMEILDQISFEAGGLLASHTPDYYENKVHFLETIIDLGYRDGKNQDRKYETHDAKVILGVDDPDLYVIVQTNDGIKVDSGQGYQYTEIDVKFHNRQGDEGREGTLLRVSNNEIDDSFLVPDDNGDLQPPWAPSDYLDAVKQSDSTDRDSFINMEMIDEFTEESGSNYPYQMVKLRLQWRKTYLMADGGLPGLEIGDLDEAIPVRLDPLQYIVNVSSGGLAVEFGDRAGAPPEHDEGKG